MKNYLSFLLVFLISFQSFSQYQPSVKWEKQVPANFGGQWFYDLKPAGSNGYIGVGTDSAFVASNYFNVRDYILDKFAGYKAWIVKLDGEGNVQWKTRNPKAAAHHYQSVQPASDGGYIAAGLTTVDPPNWDTSNVYLVKYSGIGFQQWEKTYGGTKLDAANCIIKTGSWGYLIAGYTSSTNGDVVGNHSADSTDVWLIRTDAGGNIIWKKCYGGTGNEVGNAVVQTSDKGYLVAATATSSDGNLISNNGKKDGWLFKTDSLGNLQWQKNLGGALNDGFRSLVANADGTYTAAGYFNFSTGGITTQSNFWVVRISENGNVIWSKTFGSPSNDEAFSIAATQDNNNVITGYASGNGGDVSGYNHNFDAWTIKVSAAGDLIWQKCTGSNSEEMAMSVLTNGTDEFTISGYKFDSDIHTYIVRLGNINTIKGTVYLDKNSNGIKDAGESYFNDASVKVVKGNNEFTTQPVNGDFSIVVDTGRYVSSVVVSYPYYTVVPSTDTTNFATYFNTDSIGFAVQPLPGKRDLVLNAIPLTPARPGFEISYLINYKNPGTDTISNGQVLLKKDSRLMLVSSNPSVTSTNGDTLKWNYTNLMPQDSASILVRLKVSAPPVTNINDTLVSMAFINPVAGDLTPANDTAIIRQRVQGAVDPNDKTENFGGRISTRQVGDGAYINYIIRFQNTGTDTAFNVVIRDTLDQNLQWGSFQMMAASHPNRVQVSDQNRIVWYFDNILLPDSNRNEPLSHGYVAYRIKPKTSLVEGDMMKNTAFIYFDYNFPVKTNTQVTTVSNFVNDQVTAINSPSVNTSAMVLFPNPTGDQLWLRIKDRSTGKGSLSVYDINGRLLIRKQLGLINLSDYTTSLELGGLAPGMYTIFLQAGKNLYSQKLVLR